MSAIVIMRKGSGKAKFRKPNPTDMQIADMKCRVKRPGLLDWLTSGGFHNLNGVPSTVVDSPTERAVRMLKGELSKGTDYFIIPDDSLGRAGKVDGSTAESIRLWIIDRYGDALGINRSDLAVFVSDYV